MEQAQLEEKVRDLEQEVRILTKWLSELREVISVNLEGVTITSGTSRLRLSSSKVEVKSGGGFDVRALNDIKLRADGTGELASGGTLTLRGSEVNVN